MNTQTWNIPLAYATESEPDFSDTNWVPKDWLKVGTSLKTLTVEDTNKWIVVNPDARSKNWLTLNF